MKTKWTSPYQKTCTLETNPFPLTNRTGGDCGSLSRRPKKLSIGGYLERRRSFKLCDVINFLLKYHKLTLCIHSDIIFECRVILVINIEFRTDLVIEFRCQYLLYFLVTYY